MFRRTHGRGRLARSIPLPRASGRRRYPRGMENSAPEAPAEQVPRPGPVWRFLITPRWLGWHLFAAGSFVGMLWLGDWQFRRAMSGNGLSWASTFD